MEKGFFSIGIPNEIVRGGHFLVIAGEQRILLNTNIHDVLDSFGLWASTKNLWKMFLVFNKCYSEIDSTLTQCFLHRKQIMVYKVSCTGSTLT